MDPESRLQDQIQDSELNQDSALSRRQFLKIAGVSLAGAAVTLLPTVPTSIAAFNTLQYLPIEDIRKALEIAKKAPMFQEAITELEAINIRFNIVPESVSASSAQGDLVGLLLHQSSSPSRRLGADLLLTVDLSKEILNIVQYLVGWCLVKSTKLKSVIFDIRFPLYEKLREDTVKYETPPNMIRPRKEHHWSLSRPNSPPVRPEDLVEFGWPPEAPDSHFWYFDGCTSPGWTVYREANHFRCAQAGEHQSDDARQQPVLDLVYID